MLNFGKNRILGDFRGPFLWIFWDDFLPIFAIFVNFWKNFYPNFCQFLWILAIFGNFLIDFWPFFNFESSIIFVFFRISSYYNLKFWPFFNNFMVERLRNSLFFGHFLTFSGRKTQDWPHFLSKLTRMPFFDNFPGRKTEDSNRTTLKCQFSGTNKVNFKKPGNLTEKLKFSGRKTEDFGVRPYFAFFCNFFGQFLVERLRKRGQF